MKHIKLESAEIFCKSTAKIYEYDLPDKDINWCLCDVDGRFPEKGWALNKVCKEMVFIIEGNGKLVVEGRGEVTFKKNDLVFVEPNVKYYWMAKARFGIACSPAWYPEQHETFEG